MSAPHPTAEELITTASRLEAAAAQIADESLGAMAAIDDLVGHGWDPARCDPLVQRWKAGGAELQEAMHGMSALLSDAGCLWAQTEQGRPRP